jgi:hypothetical protein
MPALRRALGRRQTVNGPGIDEELGREFFGAPGEPTDGGCYTRQTHRDDPTVTSWRETIASVGRSIYSVLLTLQLQATADVERIANSDSRRPNGTGPAFCDFDSDSRHRQATLRPIGGPSRLSFSGSDGPSRSAPTRQPRFQCHGENYLHKNATSSTFVGRDSRFTSFDVDNRRERKARMSLKRAICRRRCDSIAIVIVLTLGASRLRLPVRVSSECHRIIYSQTWSQ